MPHRILAEQEIENLLAAERIVRIGFESAGERYLVPVGYLWYNGFIHFAGTRGKKTRMAGENPNVSFQIDTSSTSGVYEWMSVTGEGRIEFVLDLEEIAEIGRRLFARFHDMPTWMAVEYLEKADSGRLVWMRIRPGTVTGRMSGPRV
jgi:nitroimidazol reductase NimA-like FMN-containing flavoprotein (pyridoxamine 5'-phosphate oxidase superfamily)